jgi:hypothetical protein
LIDDAADQKERLQSKLEVLNDDLKKQNQTPVELIEGLKNILSCHIKRSVLKKFHVVFIYLLIPAALSTQSTGAVKKRTTSKQENLF